MSATECPACGSPVGIHSGTDEKHDDGGRTITFNWTCRQQKHEGGRERTIDRIGDVTKDRTYLLT